MEDDLEDVLPMIRVDGDVNCLKCGEKYRDHRNVPLPDMDSFRIGCDGRLLKL